MAGETRKSAVIEIHMVLRPLEDGVDPMQDAVNIINELIREGVEITKFKAEPFIEFNYIKE